MDDTIEIIRTSGNYEAFHKVRLGDDAIVAAAKCPTARTRPLFAG
ncbi:MAG: hypothetical protein ACLUSP_02285 [Christensenellales bacterium]